MTHGRWLTGCRDCPQLDQYPKAIKDNSPDNYNRKKRAFTGVRNLTIITPSNWLKDIVHQSFLSEYPVEVKHNTIDKTVFKPTSSTFKQDHNIQDKKMGLGVASIWNERKGLKSKLIEGSAQALVRRQDYHRRLFLKTAGVDEHGQEELMNKTIVCLNSDVFDFM